MTSVRLLHMQDRKISLFASWHPRDADGTIRRTTITWGTDVRVCHPGQDRIREPGGFGVSDPDINAPSIATRILPQPIFVKYAATEVPGDRASPIAERVAFRNTAGAPVETYPDVRLEGPQRQDIVIETDAATPTLSKDDAVLSMTGDSLPSPIQRSPRRLSGPLPAFRRDHAHGFIERRALTPGRRHVPACPDRRAGGPRLVNRLRDAIGPVTASATLVLMLATTTALARDVPAAGTNPIIRDRFTADVAPLVVGDRLYLYAGHDEARGAQGFTMNEWVAYSTTDMRHWTAHGAIMRPTDFKWAAGEAWATQMVHRNGRYYFYVTVEHDATHPGKAIGVAVGDSPLGPFRDARGSALVTDNKATWRRWSDIDPTVFIDDDGTAWIAWGNSNLYLAKLKPNMTEIDGVAREVKLPQYLEGPWLHKRGKLYYMTYASIIEGKQKKERISYATATSLAGPWTFRGELTGEAENSFTIHAGIERFKGNWYFFYHNGALTIGDEKGGEFRRSAAVEHLVYNPDGTIRPIVQTRDGVTLPLPTAAGKTRQ